ncbi:hypothetical protein PSR62_00120 [Rhodopirellula sp. P2]|nr:hypothetical protein [Rhodopirellula sp. P2]WDQ16976.1 hypothetical protein PSR62_00120 [Rhodopirellula sp. P2]
MRTILLLGLAIGGAFMAGWFTIERDGDKTRIEINKTEIRSDTRSAIDRGRDILDERQREQAAQQQVAQQPGGYPDQGQGGYYPGGAPTNPNAWPPQGGQPVQGAGYSTPSYGVPNYNVPNSNQTPGYNNYPAAQPNAGYGEQGAYNPNVYQPQNYNAQPQAGGQNGWDAASAPWATQNR